MFQYQFNGPTPVSVPALGLDLVPGQKLEVAEEINHPDFVRITAKSKDDAGEES